MRFNVSNKSLVSLLLLASIAACGQKTKTKTVENPSTLVELEKSQAEAKQSKADNAALVAQEAKSKADTAALEAAKTEALAAQATAEAAKTAAENDEATAEAARIAAEAAKAEALTAQAAAETAKIAAVAAFEEAKAAADSARTKQEEKASVLRYMQKNSISFQNLEDTLKVEVEGKNAEIGEKERAFVDAEAVFASETTAFGQALADLDIFQTTQDKLQEVLEAKKSLTDFEKEALTKLQKIKALADQVTAETKEVEEKSNALALLVKSHELVQAQIDNLKATDKKAQTSAAQQKADDASLAQKSAEADLEAAKAKLAATQTAYQNEVASYNSFSGEVAAKLLAALTSKATDLENAEKARKLAEDKVAQAKLELSGLQDLQKFAKDLVTELTPVAPETTPVAPETATAE